MSLTLIEKRLEFQFFKSSLFHVYFVFVKTEIFSSEHNVQNNPKQNGLYIFCFGVARQVFVYILIKIVKIAKISNFEKKISYFGISSILKKSPIKKKKSIKKSIKKKSPNFLIKIVLYKSGSMRMKKLRIMSGNTRRKKMKMKVNKLKKRPRIPPPLMKKL